MLDMIEDFGATAIPLVNPSAELSVNNTRIRVNPQSETGSRACDINANLSSCRVQDENEPGSRELPPPQEPLGPSKIIHGCSFRLLYHGSSEIDELQPDSSVAPGCWKYRTKKSMVEEAVLKLKVGQKRDQKKNEIPFNSIP